MPTPFSVLRRSWRGLHSTLSLAVAVVTVAVVAPLTNAGPATADDRQYEQFYTPPEALPAGKPGDLIRTEPSRIVLEPSGQLGSYMGSGTRIMYRSTDAQGKSRYVIEFRLLRG